MDDIYFMGRAYQEALKAFDEGEIPVGAVIVHGHSIIGRGYNRIEALPDATAHAEIIAIGAAAGHLHSWRLNECTLYVTLEPCMMCLGALLHSRIARVVFGATDPRLGAVISHVHQPLIELSYHTFPAIESGVMGQECSLLIKSFFEKLREEKK